MAATWNITVSTPYSRDDDPTVYQFTYSPNGCFRGPYGHRFSDDYQLYLVHGDGETLLGGGWSRFILKSFSVRQNSQCEEEEVFDYDCINGACLKSEQYNTPGFFKTLEECETVCGEGCSGKCISKSDWNKIQDLAGKLKNKNCS